MVDPRKLHEIWNEQCEAARTIRDRYGLEAAFDYLVEDEADLSQRALFGRRNALGSSP